VVADTRCGDACGGTPANRLPTCTRCEVYARYNRSAGTAGKLVKTLHPEEHALRYVEILRNRMIVNRQELGRSASLPAA
jgi:hypothetical protein